MFGGGAFQDLRIPHADCRSLFAWVKVRWSAHSDHGYVPLRLVLHHEDWSAKSQPLPASASSRLHWMLSDKYSDFEGDVQFHWAHDRSEEKSYLFWFAVFQAGNWTALTHNFRRIAQQQDKKTPGQESGASAMQWRCAYGAGVTDEKYDVGAIVRREAFPPSPITFHLTNMPKNLLA